MQSETDNVSRREVLGGIGTAGVLVLAGCTATEASKLDDLRDTLQYQYDTVQSDSGAIIVNVDGQVVAPEGDNTVGGDVVTALVRVWDAGEISVEKETQFTMTQDKETNWSTSVVVGSIEHSISVGVDLVDLEAKPL
jgi:hypothetical protein